jgi:hypothetical protein
MSPIGERRGAFGRRKKKRTPPPPPPATSEIGGYKMSSEIGGAVKIEGGRSYIEGINGDWIETTTFSGPDPGRRHRS